MSALRDLVLTHRENLTDRLVARIVSEIPRYGLVDPGDLRATVSGLLEDLGSIIETQDTSSVTRRLAEITERRAAQGVAPAEFLRATLQIFPVLRDLIREAGPENDPAFDQAFAGLEQLIHVATAAGMSAYIEAVSRQLEAKNRELNRLNQRLMAHERALTRETEEARASLDAANEFSQRVIESLSSGVAVVDWRTMCLSLFSSRMEQILGLQAEAVLGRPVVEAMGTIEGFDPMALIETVRQTGRLTLTKMSIAPPGGRRRICFVRAERMFGIDGKPEGVVVVLDDVTERELLVDSFSRYVSRDVVQRLLARGEASRLEGERRCCTILFADIRGFTGLAESLDPEALHEVLNTYFRVMIGVVTRHGGFIDKFVGDKMMAVFDRADPARHAAAAVASTREILEEIRRLGRAREAESLPPIEIGIGVNTGEVLLGNVGSEERMDFTVIGDAVNVADRLQSLAAGGEALIGADTAGLIQGHGLEDLGERDIRGRQRTEQVFRLCPAESA
jgi:PAS domain S-box-containing protein